jgi:IclR helix-turn-helix domain
VALASIKSTARTEGPSGREVDGLRRVLGLVAERIPADWSFDVTMNTVLPGGHEFDAIVELAGPGQTKAVLVVEAKHSIETRDLPSIVARLRSLMTHVPGPTVPVVTARYLSPSARAWLEEHDISYGDATGNLRIIVGNPALYLRDTGATRDPWRGPGRPRGTLQGLPAARVVRALADYTPPVTVRELVARSGASTGATYRVVEFLEREGLLERGSRGAIQHVQWRRMLQRWSQDYGFQSSNHVTGYLHPRGLDAALEGLARSRGQRYVITGSFAAQRLEPYAPARLAMIYADDPEQIASEGGLRAVDSGANVLVAAPAYDVVYERSAESGGMNFAAPSQTAVDLLTAPGRGPSEGVALLDWMGSHESAWRK